MVIRYFIQFQVFNNFKRIYSFNVLWECLLFVLDLQSHLMSAIKEEVGRLSTQCQVL